MPGGLYCSIRGVDVLGGISAVAAGVIGELGSILTVIAGGG